MPLLHKRKVSLPSAQPPYRSTEEYWVHRVTREVFTNYKDYIERVELYRQPIWTCEYSGKSGMTYEEALLSEQHCMQLASALPKHYYQEAFRVIHQNTEGLTGLVDTLSKHLKQTFVTGERVMLKREGRLVTILKRMSTNKKTALYEVTTEENPTEYENGANEKEKEKEKEEREEEAKEDKMEEEKGEYDPLLNPRNNKKSTASQAEEQTEKKEKTRFQVLHKELVKPQAVLSKITKPILKQFIRTVANKEPYVGAPWLIREDMFDYDEYHLTKDLPPHIVTLREKYLRKVRKRGSTEMEDAESGEGASEEENSENGHGNGDHDPLLTPSKKQKKKKNAPPSYPMEDTLLPDALSRQPPVAIPLPEYFPDLLMLFFFFYTFGRPLRLSPFSLDELEKALQSSLKQNLIDEIMISLLRTINQDKGGVAVKPRGITHSSWPSILQRTLKQIASRRSFADVAEKEEEEEGEEEEGESEQEEEEEEDGESTKWKKQPNLQNGAKKAKTKTEQNKKNDEEEEESSEEEEEEEKVEVESSEEDGENSFKTTMSVLSNAGFTLLSMFEKLEILCLLCHAALDSSAIRECMNESLLNAKDILNEDQEIKENAKPENGVKVLRVSVFCLSSSLWLVLVLPFLYISALFCALFCSFSLPFS
ncbi:midasin isoform X1 [Balamuthia mandrillaris]